MSQGGAITSAGRYCLTNDIDAITFPTKTDLFTVEVVICLNGHKITGNGGSAIYIEDDYNASAGGGGVFVNGGEVSFNGGKIIDNTAANARGGGIFVKGNTVLNLDGSYVSGNSAGVGGGVSVKEYTVKYTDENGYTVTIKMY